MFGFFLMFIWNYADGWNANKKKKVNNAKI